MELKIQTFCQGSVTASNLIHSHIWRGI